MCEVIKYIGWVIVNVVMWGEEMFMIIVGVFCFLFFLFCEVFVDGVLCDDR